MLGIFTCTHNPAANLIHYKTIFTFKYYTPSLYCTVSFTFSSHKCWILHGMHIYVFTFANKSVHIGRYIWQVTLCPPQTHVVELSHVSVLSKHLITVVPEE